MDTLMEFRTQLLHWTTLQKFERYLFDFSISISSLKELLLVMTEFVFILRAHPENEVYKIEKKKTIF
jgi:hypothetical protein